MGTAANITLKNTPEPITVSVQREGYPDNMLELLAKFYKLPVEAQTADKLGKLYHQQFPYGSAEDFSLLQFETLDANFEFTVTENGELEVTWNDWVSAEEMTVAFTKVTPLCQLQITTEDYQDSVRETLEGALADLAASGITCPAAMPEACKEQLA